MNAFALDPTASGSSCVDVMHRKPLFKRVLRNLNTYQGRHNHNSTLAAMGFCLDVKEIKESYNNNNNKKMKQKKNAITTLTTTTIKRFKKTEAKITLTPVKQHKRKDDNNNNIKKKEYIE